METLARSEIEIPNGQNRRITYSPISDDYTIDSVLIDDNLVNDSVNSYTIYNIRSNYVIRVVYRLKTFAISTAAANGVITPQATVTINNSVRITYMANPNFLLDSIVIDGVQVNDSTMGYTFTNVREAHRVQVYYSPTFSIVTSVTNGAISASLQNIRNLTSARVTYSPVNENFILGTVVVDGVLVNDSTSGYTFNNINANHTIVVNYINKYYTITSSVSPGGYVNPLGAVTVEYGQTKRFTYYAGINSLLDSVFVDGVYVDSLEGYTFNNVTSNHVIYVTFKSEQKYINPIIKNAGGTINPSQLEYVDNGSTETIHVFANSSYIIDTILVNDSLILPKASVIDPSEFSFDLTNIQKNYNVTVLFKKQYYRILSWVGNPGDSLFERINAGGAITPNGATLVKDKDTQVYNIYANSGYILDSLVVNGEAVAPVNSYPIVVMGRDYTIRAKFKQTIFTINTTYALGVKINTGAKTIVPAGNTFVLSYSAEAGFVIDSVLLNGVKISITNQIVFNNLSQDQAVQIYATQTDPNQVLPKKYNIVSSSNVLNTLSIEGTTMVDSLSDLTIYFYKPSGYYLDSVFVDNVLVTATDSQRFSSITANHSLRLVYQQSLQLFTVDFEAGANGIVSPSGVIGVARGSRATVLIDANRGYVIDSIFVNGNYESGGYSGLAEYNYIINNIQQNYAVNVSFRPNLFTITANINGGGSLSPNGINYVNKGQSLRVVFNINAGVVIDSVVVDGTLVDSMQGYTFNNVSANHTLNVYTNTQSFNITSIAGSNGNISPLGNVTVALSASKTYTITPNTGYVLSAVLINNVQLPTSDPVYSTLSYTFNNINRNNTIEVQFTPTQYRITTNIGVGGRVSPSGIVTVPYNGSQTFNIVPDQGYTIDSIFIDNAVLEISNSITISNVTSNRTLKVLFRRLSYNVIVSNNRAKGQINVSDTTKVFYGTNLRVDMSANQGYIIQSIIVNGQIIDVNNISYTYNFNFITSDNNLSVVYGLNSNYKFLPNSNYQIIAKDASCNNIQNGSIILNFDSSLKYAYSLTDTLGNRISSDTFVKLDTILALGAGVYVVNIGLIDYPLNDVKQFRVTINQPRPLTAFSELIQNGKFVLLTLNGSPNYHVVLNGKTFSVRSSNIELPLKTGLNTIRVSTELECQGDYTQTYFVSEDVLLYPNPVTSNVNLYLGGEDTRVEIEVLNEKGTKLYQQVSNIPSTRQLQINTESYPDGVYFVKVKGNTLSGTYKFVKTK